MLSSFFINRPILSSVLSLFIFLSGLTALFFLPIEQFPNILPPQISVITSYSGASAQTVANSIAAPIEQQINGVENMIYMTSNCSSSGDYALSVFFDIGTDINQALIDVQNQVNIVSPSLPLEVQRGGVMIFKQSSAFLLVVGIQSPDQRYDETFLSNYATINVVEELQRTPGVSSVRIINDRTYAMRIWIDPLLLVKYGMTASDVADAVMDQNSEYSVGRLGENPTDGPVELTLSIASSGRLSTPEEFNNIILRANPDGSIIFLKDVGYAELGAQSYDVLGKIDGIPTVSIAVFQQYGANALQVAEEVKKKMEHVNSNFPHGISYSIPYDTTKFVNASIKEVVKTIIEAAILVILVVFIFLQNMRLTVIPLQAMIISIVGAFTGMLILGISINTLTLFAMVLAVGIVVDDAIVVIENVEHTMRTKGLSALEAAHHAMKEVTAPIIAIVFVLCAVFVPVAFLGGITGQLYKQFALTIAISVVISGIVALTLSPALSAVLIRPRVPSRFSRWFDKEFDRLVSIYERGARWIIVRPVIGMGAFAAVCLMVFLLFRVVPTAFVPNEDQGYLIGMVSMPEGASLARTEAVSKQAQEIAQKDPDVETIFELTGFSFMDGLARTSQGAIFIVMKDWAERTEANASAESIQGNLSRQYSEITGAPVFVFNPPAIQGLGTVGGFEFWLQNRGSKDYGYLDEMTQEFITKARQRPELAYLSSTISAHNEQIFVDLDRSKARTLEVPVSEVYRSLKGLFGSYYINNFNMFGRVYRVMMMAEPKRRLTPDDLEQVFVRSTSGKMVPLKSLIILKNSSGPNVISRFNGFSSAKISGMATPGYSSGQALQAMEEVAKEILPPDFSYAWGGESYQEKAAGGKSSIMLMGGLLMVFLILAGLYERWSLPLAIILAVPFGIFGALIAVWAAGMNNDVYFQIGLITLIALSAKNAILIVEFAVIKRDEGMSLLEAAIEAGKLRLRAILMTSLTFIFGVIPLVISSGAGANSRHSVGMGVLGGMIAATFLAVFFVPLFYMLIARWSEKKRGGPDG